MSNKLLPTGGNYKKLFCYQKAEAIYDITYYFCSNYLKRGDRTVDQMVQAARSGKQNIKARLFVHPNKIKYFCRNLIL